MSVDADEVRRIAHLARIAVADQEIAHLQGELNAILAFVEHMYGLAPLSENDANAYDYSNSFNVLQTPLKPVPMIQSRVPVSSLRWLREHPPQDDIT